MAQKPNKGGRPVIDITGQKFGRLLVLKATPKSKWHPKYGVRWVCLCDCGKKVTMFGHKLRSNQVRSCGCQVNSHLHLNYNSGLALAKCRAAIGQATRADTLSFIRIHGPCSAQDLLGILLSRSNAFKVIRRLLRDGMIVQYGKKNRAKTYVCVEP